MRLDDRQWTLDPVPQAQWVLSLQSIVLADPGRTWGGLPRTIGLAINLDYDPAPGRRNKIREPPKTVTPLFTRKSHKHHLYKMISGCARDVTKNPRRGFVRFLCRNLLPGIRIADPASSTLRHGAYLPQKRKLATPPRCTYRFPQPPEFCLLNST